MRGDLIFTELASGGQGLGMRLRQGQPHAEERSKVSINDVSYSTTVCPIIINYSRSMLYITVTQQKPLLG